MLLFNTACVVKKINMQKLFSPPSKYYCSKPSTQYEHFMNSYCEMAIRATMILPSSKNDLIKAGTSVWRSVPKRKRSELADIFKQKEIANRYFTYEDSVLHLSSYGINQLAMKSNSAQTKITQLQSDRTALKKMILDAPESLDNPTSIQQGLHGGDQIESS